MAKYSGSGSKKKQAKKSKKQSKDKTKSGQGNSFGQSRMILTVITSVLLIGYLAWRLGPEWGYGKALLVGFGLSAAYILFIYSSAIFDWVRKR